MVHSLTYTLFTIIAEMPYTRYTNVNLDSKIQRRHLFSVGSPNNCTRGLLRCRNGTQFLWIYVLETTFEPLQSLQKSAPAPSLSTISQSLRELQLDLPPHLIAFPHSQIPFQSTFQSSLIYFTIKRARENGAPKGALPNTISAMTSAQRVAALRKLMAEQKLDAFIVPTEDAHMSEYVASRDERRAFLTSFTGSAGTALVTMNAAYCWTDGRYLLQAKMQLDADVFQMMRVQEDVSVEDWIATNMEEGGRVGIDGMTVSINGMRRLRMAQEESENPIKIIPLAKDVTNLVDEVWGSARPPAPASQIVIHALEYSGTFVAEKLRNLRASMAAKEATMTVVTALDEVAWLLNLRGADVDYNPVFWAYAIVTQSEAKLYVNSTRFGEGVEQHLKQNNVSVSRYEDLLSDLENMDWGTDARVWLDPDYCNYAILDVIERVVPVVQTIKKQSPIALAKAKKCDTELAGMRACHVRDGVALTKFLCWLENEVVNLGNEPTECEAADKLDGLRAEQELFVSLSFPTISGSGSNGAIVHYRPEVGKCKKITKDDVYLVDSGGQYKDGTTDVTRTVHFGVPSAWQKECFTRVLQGHIAIDTAVFPMGTTGHVLDGFARMSLWRAGLDYSHGTGHGVGCHLNVHEGPHVISFKQRALGTALEPGFLTSNEPGYYEEGAFGIRIENVCTVVEAAVKGSPRGVKKPYYGFERVTMAPIEISLIDFGILSERERKWVDDYHKEVFEKLSPKLKDDSATLEWLKRKTVALAEG